MLIRPVGLLLWGLPPGPSLAGWGAVAAMAAINLGRTGRDRACQGLPGRRSRVVGAGAPGATACKTLGYVIVLR